MLIDFIQIINFLSGISSKINTHIGIIVCIVIGVPVMVYTFLVVRHYPRHKLSARQVADIKKYGLMHFTHSYCTNSIMEMGIVPNPKKKMSQIEHKFVWMYIANPSQYDEKVKEIHSKWGRDSYDSVIFLKNISDEDLSKMSCRIFPEAIVYPGTYKTSDMAAKEI